MQAVFGPVVGRALARIHQAAGVVFRTGERVRRVSEHPGGLVVHTDRAELPCGLLLVAAGIRPNVEFLASCGLDLADGVPVDEYCRTGIEASSRPATSPLHFIRYSKPGTVSSIFESMSHRGSQQPPKPQITPSVKVLQLAAEHDTEPEAAD